MIRWLTLCAVLWAAGAQGATTVEFRIDMRAEIAAGRFDPAADRVGVRGSAAPLSWDRSAPAADADRDGIYTARLHFGAAPFGGQAVAYKFKIERPGAPDAGWETGRNHPLLLREPEQRLERAFNAPPAVLPALRTGRIDRLPPPASQLVKAREVQVWVPPDYDREPERRYPVLYLHDGQNVFDADAAGAEWQVDETAQRLVDAGAISPVIVVAVASTDTRIADYTPYVMQFDAAGPAGGGAARYARFLVDELKPLIDRRYRTRPEAAHTAVGGSSLGALVTMWLLLHEAETFGAGLVVSPAVWWGDGALLKELAAAPPAPGRLRVWLDVGLREGSEAVDGARRLRETLAAKGWQVRFTEQPSGSHDEASWASRVEDMLRFLYGTPR